MSIVIHLGVHPSWWWLVWTGAIIWAAGSFLCWCAALVGDDFFLSYWLYILFWPFVLIWRLFMFILYAGER